MGVLVRIPTPLRRMTNGQDKVEMDAAPVGELIGELDNLFPGLKERLVEDSGELRHFVNIFLNGEDVRFLQEMDTVTKSGDEVSIVPAVAGGA